MLNFRKFKPLKISTFNEINRFVQKMILPKLLSNHCPWFGPTGRGSSALCYLQVRIWFQPFGATIRPCHSVPGQSWTLRPSPYHTWSWSRQEFLLAAGMVCFLLVRAAWRSCLPSKVWLEMSDSAASIRLFGLSRRLSIDK